MIFTIHAGGEEIVTTAYHPFWVVEGERLESRPVPGKLRNGEDEGFNQVGRWVSSNDLLAGDVLITVEGERITIEQIHQRFEKYFRVVNLTVATNPSFAVGSAGILVHNVSDCDLYQISPNAPNSGAFKGGQLFEKVFETSQGKVGFLAETIINGKTLHLKDIVIEPVKTGVLKVGITEVSALKDQLIAQARAAGFDKLILTGERLTGANPGKIVEIIIDLTK